MFRLSWAGEEVQPLRILDSFPVPLCACYRIRQSTQPISGSSFGYNSSKGFVGAPLEEEARALLDLRLQIRQRDYPGRFVSFYQHILDALRTPIEGVISVLTENFGLEHILVRSDIGIYRRTQAKATAYSLARYFNDALQMEPMNVSRYAV